MKQQFLLLLSLLLCSTFAFAQDISGKWMGKLLQNSGGLTNEYYFEMTLKQKGNIISGTSFIAMGKNREISGLMSIRGTFDGTYFYYEDMKVLRQQGMTDVADWCIKKCKFKFTQIGEKYKFDGHWTGNSRFGYCSPGTIKVGKEAPKKAAIDETIVIKGSEDKILPKIVIQTVDEEGNEISARLEIKEKGMGEQRVNSTGKHSMDLTIGQYQLIAKVSGYYDGVENFEVKSKDHIVDVRCVLKKIREGDSFEINNLQFDRSKATITSDSEDTLNRLVEFMKANDQVKIRINGHTDNVGSKYLNHLLSYNRANAVIVFLVKHGINQKRLTAKGLGSSIPIADNQTVEGRAKNRRVEFEVIGL